MGPLVPLNSDMREVLIKLFSITENEILNRCYLVYADILAPSRERLSHLAGSKLLTLALEAYLKVKIRHFRSFGRVEAGADERT